MKNLNILCVIPARSGSKRIHRKNLKTIDGETLVEIAARHAHESERITEVVVSSDNQDFACGEKWVPRPEAFSTDSSDIADVARHALQTIEMQQKKKYDYVVILQPAVPVRTARIIDQLITCVIEGG